MAYMHGIYSSWQQIQQQKYRKIRDKLGGQFDLIFSGNLLDLGCGFGYLEKIFQGRSSVSLFVGVDNSAEMLRNQVAVFPRVLADGNKLPFRDRCFDSVISIDAMHLINGSDFIRVLKTGGFALLSVFFNDQNFDERKHMLLEKMNGMEILREFEMHGKEKEYVIVAAKREFIQPL